MGIRKKLILQIAKIKNSYFKRQFFAVYIYENLCYPHHNERLITERITKYKITAIEKIIVWNFQKVCS